MPSTTQITIETLITVCIWSGCDVSCRQQFVVLLFLENIGICVQKLEFIVHSH